MLPRRLSNGVAYTPSGAMTCQIQLLQRSKKRDAMSNYSPPEVFANCWARVEALTSKYTEKPQQVVTEATHRVTIKYRPGVTTAMLVQFNNRVFNIEAVLDPDERQVELRLMCYERQDGNS